MDQKQLVEVWRGLLGVPSPNVVHRAKLDKNNVINSLFLVSVVRV